MDNVIKFPDFTQHGVAPCASADPESFFPDRNGVVGILEIRAAKRICNACPYQSRCLSWALSNNETGIWGGTTELERKRLRRENKRRAVV